MVTMRALTALTGLASLVASPALAGARASNYGVWRNPSNTVHIRTHACGAAMCGTVIWASDKAKADAARGGTTTLIGLSLFRDFTLDADGVWHGKVFVPDLGSTFSGTITFSGRSTMIGTGCLVAGLACKSQSWTRLK